MGQQKQSSPPAMRTRSVGSGLRLSRSNSAADAVDAALAALAVGRFGAVTRRLVRGPAEIVEAEGQRDVEARALLVARAGRAADEVAANCALVAVAVGLAKVSGAVVEAALAEVTEVTIAAVVVRAALVAAGPVEAHLALAALAVRHALRARHRLSAYALHAGLAVRADGGVIRAGSNAALVDALEAESTLIGELTDVVGGAALAVGAHFTVAAIGVLRARGRSGIHRTETVETYEVVVAVLVRGALAGDPHGQRL